jgi:Tol biopolymer transport system component
MHWKAGVIHMLIVRLGATAIALVLMLAGGLCPGSQPGAGGITTSGLFVYIVRQAASTSLWVGNQEGSILSQLGVSFSPPATPTDGATLSPDRERVAFAMPTQGRLNDIYVINRDGQSGPVNITNTPTVDEADPDWSREGSSITYAAEGDIWSIRPDGSGRRNITETPDLIEANPSWSPDGSQVAYTLNPDLPNSDVETIGQSGEGRTPIAADADLDEFAPSWSPTGSRVAFSGRPIVEEGTNEVVDVYLVDLDAGSRRNVTNAKGDVLCVGPAWSPDESTIAFRGTRRGAARSDIWSVRSSGTGAGVLVQLPNPSNQSAIHVDWR